MSCDKKVVEQAKKILFNYREMDVRGKKYNWRGKNITLSNFIQNLNWYVNINHFHEYNKNLYGDVQKQNMMIKNTLKIEYDMSIKKKKREEKIIIWLTFNLNKIIVELNDKKNIAIVPLQISCYDLKKIEHCGSHANNIIIRIIKNKEIELIHYDPWGKDKLNTHKIDFYNILEEVKKRLEAGDIHNYSRYMPVLQQKSFVEKNNITTINIVDTCPVGLQTSENSSSKLVDEEGYCLMYTMFWNYIMMYTLSLQECKNEPFNRGYIDAALIKAITAEYSTRGILLWVANKAIQTLSSIRNLPPTVKNYNLVIIIEEIFRFMGLPLDNFRYVEGDMSTIKKMRMDLSALNPEFNLEQIAIQSRKKRVEGKNTKSTRGKLTSTRDKLTIIPQDRVIMTRGQEKTSRIVSRRIWEESINTEQKKLLSLINKEASKIISKKRERKQTGQKAKRRKKKT